MSVTLCSIKHVSQNVEKTMLWEFSLRIWESTFLAFVHCTLVSEAAGSSGCLLVRKGGVYFSPFLQPRTDPPLTSPTHTVLWRCFISYLTCARSSAAVTQRASENKPPVRKPRSILEGLGQTSSRRPQYSVL